MRRIILIILVVIICITAKGNEKVNAEDTNFKYLEGQWKITEYLTSRKMRPDYDIYEHYLGRSIVIEPNRIITSIGYWPNEVGYSIQQYRCIDVDVVNAYEYGGENRLEEPWVERWGQQDIVIVSYYMPEEASRKFRLIITDDGEVLCGYMNNIFYLEKYKNAITDLKMEQLYGKWEVKRLVSYQDGWKGNNAVLNRQHNVNEYKEEEGAYFHPQEYIGNNVEITSGNFVIYQNEDLLEKYNVNKYSVSIVDKYDYQNKKGIHDELGIENDKIQVFSGNDCNGLWDGDIVVIDESEIIIKLYQGWYLPERIQ